LTAIRLMLDTDVVSEILRDPHGFPRDRIAQLGGDGLAISVIVAAELRYGAAKRGSDRLERQIDSAIAKLVVAPFEPPADREYAQLRDHLRRAGQPIGANDLFIAAHALALALPLVTANVSEFERVPGLRVVRWR
jgi:tRNA(fMet)-specific endonuclease VapC